MILVSAIIIMAGAYSFLMGVNYVPDTMVLVEKDINDRIITAVNEAEPLRPDEQIKFFYSTALWSFSEEGNVITNQRLIVYGDAEDGERASLAVPYEMIQGIEVEEKGSPFEDALYRVRTFDDGEFWFVLSAEDGLHNVAFKYAQAQLMRVRSLDDVDR